MHVVAARDPRSHKTNKIISMLVANVWWNNVWDFQTHSQTFLEVLLAWRKEKSAHTSWPRLGLEVPDILLSDIGDQPNIVSRMWSDIHLLMWSAASHILCEREGEGEVPGKPCPHVSTMFFTTGGADFFSVEMREGTAKKLCDKDSPERSGELSGELSGATCLKTLVLLSNNLLTPLNCSEKTSLWCFSCDSLALWPLFGSWKCQNPLEGFFLQKFRHSLRGSLLRGRYNNSLHVPLAVPTPAPTPPPWPPLFLFSSTGTTSPPPFTSPYPGPPIGTHKQMR